MAAPSRQHAQVVQRTVNQSSVNPRFTRKVDGLQRVFQAMVETIFGCYQYHAISTEQCNAAVVSRKCRER
jgi:hypothetical protein